MIRTIIKLLGIFLILPVVGVAQMSERVAYVKNITGEVSIMRDNSATKAQRGSQLKNSDIIKTFSNASVGIVFIDNTRLSLGENTEISLNKYKFDPMTKEYAFSLFMKKGQALYSSGKLSKLAPEKINFQTPRATVGVRGTKFLVQVD